MKATAGPLPSQQRVVCMHMGLGHDQSSSVLHLDDQQLLFMSYLRVQVSAPATGVGHQAGVGALASVQKLQSQE